MQQKTKQLQKHADNMHMMPIWAYAKKIRTENKHKHCSLQNDEGAITKNEKEILEQWAKHIKNIAKYQ